MRTRSGQGVDDSTNNGSGPSADSSPLFTRNKIPHSALTSSSSQVISRRTPQYQSTSSLASESPSPNSPSPAPSPSPSQNYHPVQLREKEHGTVLEKIILVTYSLLNYTILQGNYMRHSTGPDNGMANYATAVNKFQTAKRWSSTSDFASNHQTSSK